MIGLRFQKIENQLWILETGYIPSIIQELQKGNTIIYFMLQENIYLGSGNIFMELEVLQTETPKNESEQFETT